ncbi:Hpt domain-containing protein [Occallatibacter savannae]|uniref:Hpt domain-containing protein n=1 Tax=Occallatibacter savannae TaxID=1002691 RepID=UPI0013A54085|nr:Hpt domain-containing protein [Occallatibacter savannae]
MMGDEEFARAIAAIFAGRLPALLNEVKESMAKGATEAFQGSIHTIKGSAANVGGEALSNVAQRIEQNEIACELPVLIADLESQAELLMAVIRNWTK